MEYAEHLNTVAVMMERVARSRARRARAPREAKIKIDGEVYEVPSGELITFSELLRMAPNRFGDEYARIARRRVYQVKGEALLFAAANCFCENSDPKRFGIFRCVGGRNL